VSAERKTRQHLTAELKFALYGNNFID